MSIPPVAPTLPRERILAVYWIPAVGIGKTKPYEWVTVPLKEVSEQPRLPDGRPQTTVVFLGFAQAITSGRKQSSRECGAEEPSSLGDTIDRAPSLRAGQESYSGIFPCFFGGFLSRLVWSISRASISRLRVSDGWITAST